MEPPAPRRPWTSLHAHIHHTLKQRDLIPPGSALLVAVSGGQDSLCLIRLLLDLRPKWDWQLAIAHCNHNWRPDALANANHVRQLAQAWQIPYYERTANDLSPGEAAARDWRYQMLTEMAASTGYSHVATGHTASDRAETLLYNLIRGSGADGLQALTWSRPLTPTVHLIRPLLPLTRGQTAQFCQDAQLKIWEDATNQDLGYVRNRIRQELIPYLQTHFNPSTESTLAHTAELLQADVAYLEAQAAACLVQASHPTTPGLHRPSLQSLPLALQRRTIRQFLQTLLPTSPSFDHIEKVVALIQAPQRSQTDPFPGGAIARIEQDWIRFDPVP
jgi:tRNA(Ile)-lysidine synthase